MTEPDVRALLVVAAGAPEPGQLLQQVRRRALRARRRRRLSAALATVVVLAAAAGGTAVAVRGGRDGRTVLAQSSAAPTTAPATAPASAPAAATSPPAGPATSTPASGGPDIGPAQRCTAGDLTAGLASDVHVLAGEETMDVPIQATSACALALSDLTLSPDAAVPVKRTPGTTLWLPARGIAHLTLGGESDGFCETAPDAKTVRVSTGGRQLASVALPNLGLCTEIDAALRLDPAGGETPACTAGMLAGFALPLEGGNGTTQVDALLRNDSRATCFLAGYPATVTAGTVDGLVTDLQTLISSSAANGVYLAPGDVGFVGVGGLNAAACSQDERATVRNGPFVELTVELQTGGGVAVPFAGTPFDFPCGPVSTTAFQAPPTGAFGPSLSVSPTSAPVGGTVTASGTVGNLSLCPVVEVTVAADGGTGAGDNLRVPVTADTAHGGGTFSVQVRVPTARDGSTGVGTAAAVRAFCDKADGSATNTGDTPEVSVTRTG